MNAASIPDDLRLLAPGIAARVALILRGLATLVAARPFRRPNFVPQINSLWSLLMRAAGRIELLMANLAAGRLRKSGPRANPNPSPDPTPRPPCTTPPPHRLPSEKAWLLRELLHEAAYFRAHLETLFAEPGIADLLATAPQAARILRPICRMLGLDLGPGLSPAVARPPRTRRRPAPAPPAGQGPPLNPPPRNPHPLDPPSPDRRALRQLQFWRASIT